MKIRFTGIFEKSTSGCGACGKSVHGENIFVTTKGYILPSGATKTFKVGQEYDVSEMDGRFLLSYNYHDVNGTRRAVFEEVK